MTKPLTVLILIAWVLTACAAATPSASQVETAIANTQAAQLTATDLPAPTLTPTFTPRPTRTPAPPRPTETLPPTYTLRPTSTPEPTPIRLSGNGDDVVDFQKWDGVALAKIKYTGGSNFSIKTFDQNDNPIDLIVNTIGAYQGTRLIDLRDGEDTTRIQVKASGPWEIYIEPLTTTYLNMRLVPSSITGKGDDVFFIYTRTGAPDLLKIDASNAQSNFIILALSRTPDHLVNEIAPYTGTVRLDPDTMLLIVTATGEYTLEITTR